VGPCAGADDQRGHAALLAKAEQADRTPLKEGLSIPQEV